MDIDEGRFRAKKSAIETEYTKIREAIEQRVWTEIDRKIEVNKEDLVVKIEEGMSKKKDLTLAQHTYDQTKQVKHEAQRKLATKQEKLSAIMNNIAKEKKTIELNEMELQAREETLHDKKEKITSLKKKI